MHPLEAPSERDEVLVLTAAFDEMRATIRQRDIARALGTTERPVEYHIGGLLLKMRASNRTGLVRAATDAGLVGL